MIPGLDFIPALGLRAKAGLVAALGLAVLALALTTWALWERAGAAVARAEAIQARAERDRALDQVDVLAASLGRCNKAAEEARRVGDQVVATTAAMLERARKLAAPRQKDIERIETIIERPVPMLADGTPAGCDAAWAELEAMHGKARAPR